MLLCCSPLSSVAPRCSEGMLLHLFPKPCFPNRPQHGIPLEEARKQCYFLDSKGLVCKSRLAELQHHKIPFAHVSGRKGV